MGDVAIMSYPGNVPVPSVDRHNIYAELPDQFTRYESELYNPIDFYTSSGEFNLANFNKTYREEQLKRINFYRNEEIKRLREMAQWQPPPSFFQLSIGEHLVRMKDSFFGTIYDLQTEPLSINIITKNNRLFYIGLFLILVFVVYLVLSSFVAGARNGRGKSDAVDIKIEA